MLLSFPGRAFQPRFLFWSRLCPRTSRPVLVTNRGGPLPEGPASRPDSRRPLGSFRQMNTPRPPEPLRIGFLPPTSRTRQTRAVGILGSFRQTSPCFPDRRLGSFRQNRRTPQP